MNHKEPMDDLRERILKTIREQRVPMRSRAYFVLRTALIVVLGVLALVFATTVLSFVFISLHRSGELFLLGFGGEGIRTFLMLFPWGLTLIVLVLILLIEHLLRTYSSGYRFSILAVFGALVGIAAVVSLLLTVTPYHDLLEGNVPFLAPAYEGLHHPHVEAGEYWGVVQSVGTSTVTIVHDDYDHSADDGTTTVAVPPGVDLSQVHPGDRVYIGGHLYQGTIRAYGLRAFPKS